MGFLKGLQACDLHHTRAAGAEIPKHSTCLKLEAEIWSSHMAAIARMLSRASGTEVDVKTLKTLIMFCGVGLTVSMMLASYGVDLSAGFF